MAISAYRPGNNTASLTVFSQQKSYFDNLNDERQTMDIMIKELCHKMQKWEEKGVLIIVLLNTN